MSGIEVVDWSPEWAEQYDDAADVPTAISALESVGYVHRGDLGVAGREAFHAPGEVLQQVLEASGEFSEGELEAIRRLNAS